MSSNSYWNVLETTMSARNFSTDPTAVLHSHLASALSTLGDAQYWEESISPIEIRQSLTDADPSNPSSVPVLLKGMKWLLASVSKGRDVSDFYVQVVKLVACPSMEVRKMVYTYLVQYADHNHETRELSLLSINSFQRGLNDSEPLIRALALRVLTSVQLRDILSIQILAVTKHAAHDTSPYVRKCAAMAVAKLYPRCRNDKEQRSVLLDLVVHQLLNQETTTMVLSSALIAFAELTQSANTHLHLLHGSYRKLCHLLTDMDEWGQVVALEILTRYCRYFFREPAHYAHGSAEQIDASRRVMRRLDGFNNKNDHVGANEFTSPTAATTIATPRMDNGERAQKASAAGVTLPSRVQHNKEESHRRKIIKRRVVKKGFYSDEEDESAEEEVYADTIDNTNGMQKSALQNRCNEPAVASNGIDDDGIATRLQKDRNGMIIHEEEADLDEDHRLLLHSALPLLKSRNAGVVLAVSSLHYYCGVSSIPVRKAMGKALVRIHRDRHIEIQYVVLTSIRRLVRECPSAFAPFLHDFFVLPDMDPPFTRLIKLDILTSLALDPPSITTVLKELRTYVQLHSGAPEDAEFVKSAVTAVGRVVEMARIVYDRHGAANDRVEANTIALNCLYGLCTLSQTADHENITGECVIVMQRILQMLQSDRGSIHDPNKVQERALRRLLVLLVYTLSCLVSDDKKDIASDDDDDSDNNELEEVFMVLPPNATASALWLVTEYLASTEKSMAFGIFDAASRSHIRLEITRLLARCFLDLDSLEREQAIHWAGKLIVSGAQQQEAALCELLLAMGRLDINPDVRDQARYESGLILLTIGLKLDRDGMDDISIPPSRILSIQDAERILLEVKPSSSYLPFERKNSSSFNGGNTEEDDFRFGTLSSLVGHRARSTYLPLPPWSTENSPCSLREPPKPSMKEVIDIQKGQLNGGSEFYNSSSSSSSDNDSSSSESSSSEDEDESEDSSSSSSSDTDSKDEHNNRVNDLFQNGSQISRQHPIPSHHFADSSQSSDDHSESSASANPNVDNLIPLGSDSAIVATSMSENIKNSAFSSVAEDLKGLVLDHITEFTIEPNDSNFERDSGCWVQLIRPEHAKGLSLHARYLRGVTKAQQAQVLGLTADKSTVVCLQLRFQNLDSRGSSPIRHIRILQRAASSSNSVVVPRKVVVPPEINLLGLGQKIDCFIGFDFYTASDRDGSWHAKLEIKFGSGGLPVDIKPTIADLLLPCTRSVTEFDAALTRMQGFNRLESKFSIPAEERERLPKTLLSRASLSSIGKSMSWDEDKMRLAGSLPASGDPVFILITCPEEGTGKILICCDHALVLNSIMNILKRAIADDMEQPRKT